MKNSSPKDLSKSHLPEKWKSHNATLCIQKHELPLGCMDIEHISKFLVDYQRAYPQRITEYIFLSKCTPDDWKFCAKRLYQCTSWHHFGPLAQRAGFWDMWALSDKLLAICKTAKGEYRHQLLKDLQNRYYKSARDRMNSEYNKNIVRLCVFKYANDSITINAPGLLREFWTKSQHKKFLIYFDYLDHDAPHCCDTPHEITNAELSVPCTFAITTVFTELNDEMFEKFSIIPLSSFHKLINYAKSNDLIISQRGVEDTRELLEYKGPPVTLN